MIRPKGLGRGLDALLAGTDDEAPSKDALQTLAIDRLRPGRYQPRTKMDDGSLAELADSIRALADRLASRPCLWEAARFENLVERVSEAVSLKMHGRTRNREAV